MKLFRVTMFVELDGPAESDLQIKKSVQASDEIAALEKARHLVQPENPDVNAEKIWAWSIERTRS
ncbi:hypothetical protein ACQVBX_02825 [Dyella sp. KULCS107]|uniref:hypothetical protein n=1 Tax=Dyella sp. KULCS107 TaxID=3422216 RepID=UPI003D6E8E01